MRKTGLTKQHNRKDKGGKVQNSSFHGFVSLSVCALTVLTVTGGCKLIGSGRQNQVYAASEQKSSTYTYYTDDSLPTGIAGVVSGVNATPSAGMTVKRIGISCDDECQRFDDDHSR